MKFSTLPLFLSLVLAAPAAVLTPDAVVGDILVHNPELAFYEAELAAAKAARQAAGSRENPVVSLTLGRKRVTDPAGTLAGEGAAWSVSVAQTFDWPGRLSLRKAIANDYAAVIDRGFLSRHTLWHARGMARFVRKHPERLLAL